MSNINKKETFTSTFNPKFIEILRKHALIEERITMSEMVERYQASYLKELNRKDLEKKAVKCPSCSMKIIK